MPRQGAPGESHELRLFDLGGKDRYGALGVDFAVSFDVFQFAPFSCAVGDSKPVGDFLVVSRKARAGCWNSRPYSCRTADRVGANPASRYFVWPVGAVFAPKVRLFYCLNV